MLVSKILNNVESYKDDAVFFLAANTLSHVRVLVYFGASKAKAVTKQSETSRPLLWTWSELQKPFVWLFWFMLR